MKISTDHVLPPKQRWSRYFCSRLHTPGLLKNPNSDVTAVDYQSNKSPGPTLGNLEESIQRQVETFSTKKHPKGKRFYSRSIRQLKGTQVVFFMSTGGAGPVTVTALWHFSFSACVSTSITSWNTQKHPVTSIHKKTCTANTREAQSISTNSMRI